MNLNLPTALLPRDCYTGDQIRTLLARRNRMGDIVPLTRGELYRARCQGRLPFIKFGSRLIMYPRALVDASLARASESLAVWESTQEKEHAKAQ